MVVPIPDDMRAAMKLGPHRARYVADTFYDGLPTMTGLTLSRAGNITGRSDGNIQTTGRCTIESNEQILDGKGNRIAPEYAVDALATYGQEIVISRQVLLGDTLLGTTSLGRFRITDVPSIDERGRAFGTHGSRLITSSTVEVGFSDQLELIDAAGFGSVQAAADGATVWSEVRRFSPIPVVESLPDAPVPTSTIYDDSRTRTLESVLGIVGGVPHITRDGAFSGRLSDPFTANVEPFDLTGTIQPMQRSMSNDFHNHVIVTATINGKEQVLAEAMIRVGPLRFDGPAGDRVYKRAAGVANTPDAAQALANSVLVQVSQRRTRTVRVTALPDVQIELGDAVRATDPQTGRTEQGMVSSLTWPLDPLALMTFDLETKVSV